MAKATKSSATREPCSHVVATRVTEKEAARFKEAADREERNLSAFFRLAALRGLAEYERDPRSIIETLKRAA